MRLFFFFIYACLLTLQAKPQRKRYVPRSQLKKVATKEEDDEPSVPSPDAPPSVQSATPVLATPSIEVGEIAATVDATQPPLVVTPQAPVNDVARLGISLPGNPTDASEPVESPTSSHPEISSTVETSQPAITDIVFSAEPPHASESTVEPSKPAEPVEPYWPMGLSKPVERFKPAAPMEPEHVEAEPAALVQPEISTPNLADPKSAVHPEPGSSVDAAEPGESQPPSDATEVQPEVPAPQVPEVEPQVAVDPASVTTEALPPQVQSEVSETPATEMQTEAATSEPVDAEISPEPEYSQPAPAQSDRPDASPIEAAVPIQPFAAEPEKPEKISATIDSVVVEASPTAEVQPEAAPESEPEVDALTDAPTADSATSAEPAPEVATTEKPHDFPAQGIPTGSPPALEEVGIAEVAPTPVHQEDTEAAEPAVTEDIGKVEVAKPYETLSVGMALAAAAFTAWVMRGKSENTRAGKNSVAYIFKDHQPHPLEKAFRPEVAPEISDDFLERLENDVRELRRCLDAMKTRTENFETVLAHGYGQILMAQAAEEASTASG